MVHNPNNMILISYILALDIRYLTSFWIVRSILLCWLEKEGKFVVQFCVMRVFQPLLD